MLSTLAFPTSNILAARTGVPTSLVELGYTHVGIDDGWQECGAGSELPTSFHDAAGLPILNTSKFASLASLVSYAAGYDMALGWYINNCIVSCHTAYIDAENTHPLSFLGG